MSADLGAQEAQLKAESGNLAIKKMTLSELSIAITMAAKEGWNPGLYDAQPYYETDKHAFWALWLDNEIIGLISAVCYFNKIASFAYIGFFIVRESFRKKGYGSILWNHAIKNTAERIGSGSIYLYAVPQQELRYKNEGFISYDTIHRFSLEKSYEFTSTESRIEDKSTVFGNMVTYDQSIWGASREKLLRGFLKNPDSIAAVCIKRNSKIVTAYGFIRRCLSGFRIGPMAAKNYSSARKVMLFLLSKTPVGSAIIIDTPQSQKNEYVLKLLNGLGFTENREMKIISMFRGERNSVSPVNQAEVIALASLEIG